jgi:hypothetical protein
MKITFLGTGAHDYSARLLTDCKDKFDKDARRSSAVMIGESYLIDCGDHILDELRIAEGDPAGITDIFNTHQHGDHFNSDNLLAIAKCAAKKIRLWVREGAKIPDISGVEIVYMTPFVRYEVAEGIYVTGMPANHADAMNPQHFIFEIGEKKLFYGCDGGWLLNATYNYMRKQEFDLMVLDCTVGDYVGDFRLGEHNAIPMIRLMLPSFKTTKITKEDTEIYLSHIAPSLHAPHAETEKIARDMGCILAYDGLTIEM